jgi:hypothetical protein
MWRQTYHLRHASAGWEDEAENRVAANQERVIALWGVITPFDPLVPCILASSRLSDVDASGRFSATFVGQERYLRKQCTCICHQGTMRPTLASPSLFDNAYDKFDKFTQDDT